MNSAHFTNTDAVSSLLHLSCMTDAYLSHFTPFDSDYSRDALQVAFQRVVP